jgi:hypothetical protein
MPGRHRWNLQCGRMRCHFTILTSGETSATLRGCFTKPIGYPRPNRSIVGHWRSPRRASGRTIRPWGFSCNNLGGLLKATDRLVEAKPLIRRVLAILLDFERKTGHPHPHRDAALRNYGGLLTAMGKSEGEINTAIASLAGEDGSRGPH